MDAYDHRSSVELKSNCSYAPQPMGGAHFLSPDRMIAEILEK